MNYVDLVAVLALLQMLGFSVLVGQARGRHGVKAPAVSGHPQFERLYRVHMNTLELVVLLLPALYLASRHWSPTAAAVAGTVYLVGRLVYWRAYVAAPERRALGFALSAAPIGVLLAGTVVGLLRGGLAG